MITKVEIIFQIWQCILRTKYDLMGILQSISMHCMGQELTAHLPRVGLILFEMTQDQ